VIQFHSQDFRGRYNLNHVIQQMSTRRAFMGWSSKKRGISSGL